MLLIGVIIGVVLVLLLQTITRKKYIISSKERKDEIETLKDAIYIQIQQREDRFKTKYERGYNNALMDIFNYLDKLLEDEL